MQTSIKPKEAPTAEFFKACKSKNVTFVGLNYEKSVGKAELCITVTEKAFEQEYEVRVRGEVDLRITNYSGFRDNVSRETIDPDRITRLFFGDTTYRTFNHLKTFAKMAGTKKGKDMWFEAVIFNGYDSLYSIGYNAHQLYGCFGDDRYLLFSYVGPNNSASPVTYV